MEQPFTICDGCQESFTTQNIPLILVNCGHTFCKNCVSAPAHQVKGGKKCPDCGEITPNDMIRPNKKVLKYFQNRDSSKNSLVGAIN